MISHRQAVAPTAGASFTGSAPVAVDSVTGAILATLPDTNVNGVVVKVAGTDSLYGRGQAFMVLEEGAGDATDSSSAGSVLARIDALGSFGTSGGLHVASGLRKAYGGTQAVWVDPCENTHGVVIHPPSVAESATWDKDYLRVVDVRNADAVVFRITSAGAVLSTQNVTGYSGTATQAVIGNMFGFAGVGFGSSTDTLLYRSAAGIVSVANAFEFSEMTAPSAPAANKVRLFSRDNGSGKTQLCAIFPTGAVQVLATEP